MTTWYAVEDNGNLLAMTTEAEPSWFKFSGRGDWRASIAEAIEARRLGFQSNIDSCKRNLETAQSKLDRFERDIRAAGLVPERGGPLL